MLKIALVNSEDIRGGAARAALRLYKALVAQGHSVDYVVLHNRSGNPEFVSGTPSEHKKAMRKRKMAKLTSYFFTHRNPNLSYPLYLDSGKSHLLEKGDYDVVHLHWINDTYINPKSLLKIKKPLVWTLHDMWPFTGGCHYAFACSRYEESCGSCPLVKVGPGMDMTHKIWEDKNTIYPKLKLEVVTPSNWMGKCAQKSSLFKNIPVTTIPNTIETGLFSPQNKGNARQKLGLPLDKTLILFGAINSTTDPRKGYKHLADALEVLSNENRDDIELVVLGSKSKGITKVNNIKRHNLGTIEDDEELVSIYRACDMLIVPSIQDNLPNMIMEAMSCGIPVVAFNTGGISDMVKHEVNGYLSDFNTKGSLAEGIKWIINCEENLGEKAREHVLNNYDSKEIVEQHLRIYERILETSNEN